MKKSLIFIFTFCFCRSLWAFQELNLESAPAASPEEGAKPYFTSLELAPVDLLIPMKWGVHFGFRTSATQTWEIEYVRGSISVPFIIDDLGSAVDDRFSLNLRQFYGGSFNFFYGLDYLRFKIELGGDLLNRLPVGNTVPNLELLQLASWGAHLGVGNQWKWGKSGIWGIDWLAWTQPLLQNYRKTPFTGYASNPEDRDDVEKTIDFIQYFPRFTVFRLYLGTTF